MGTRPPSIPRVAAMVLFALSCFGLLLFLWLSFGGPVPLKPKGYRFEVGFRDATQLAQQADVRIAGVSVGKVIDKDLDQRSGRTVATIELDRDYAPVRQDGTATLRQKTLLGETYVEMTTGDRDAPPVPENGRLDDGRVAETVEFDEFLALFPRETRRAFRRWQANAAEGIEGRGADLNAALGGLGPFAEAGADLTRVLERRKEALRALVRETGTVFEAFTQDEDALQAFLADTSTWFQATASRRERLAEAIRIFPTFLDESKATLARLEDFSVDTNPLVRDLRPVARDLQPTLRDLGTLAPDLRRFFGDLPALIEASEDGLPALSRVLRALEPTLAATGPFLGQLNPLLNWLEINNGFVSDFLGVGPSALAGRRATINPNANGHVLPQLIVTGSQSVLSPKRTEDNRGNSYLSTDDLSQIHLYADGFNILPTWDCINAGGEKKATDTPGCKVQEPPEFQGRRTKFPQLRERIARDER